MSLPALLVLGALALAAAPAIAAQGHAFSFGFGSAGSEAGELSLVPGNSNAPGSGLAVNDTTGHVYVADTGNNRVDEFEVSAGSSTAVFVRAWGWGVDKEKPEAKLQTCTQATGCVTGLSGTEPGELKAPAFVAVDNSAGPSHGDVYVGSSVGQFPSNERQRVKVANATGGTYTLGFEGQTTGPIAFNAEAFRVQADLEGLSTVGAGNVAVGVQAGGRFVIEFVGGLAEKHLPQLTGDASGLAPAGATVQVDTEVEGSPSAPGVVSKFTATGELVEGWGSGGRLDGSSAPNGPFGPLAGVAVDGAGVLWVYVGGTVKVPANHVYEFEESGAFKGPGPQETANNNYSPQGIAVDGLGNLFLSANGGAVLRLPPVQPVFAGFLSGLAVAPSTSDVYVDHAGSSIADISSHCVPSPSGCSPVQVFGSLQLSGAAGVAVDSTGTVFVANTLVDQIAVFALAVEVNPTPGSASEVKATSATLNGAVNPEGSLVDECRFEYATAADFAETPAYTASVPCEQGAAAIGEGTVPVPVRAKISGLHAGTTYHFRLQAKKGAATLTGDDEVFSTLEVPVITAAEAREVTATGAELRASVNPEGSQITRCAFEYGTSGEYGQLAKCEPAAAQIGGGTEPVPVTTRLTGLEPNVTYHWRIAAHNGNGESEALDHTFVYDTTGATLPDGRAYEMVSPPVKNGAAIGAIALGLLPGVSRAGTRVIATSIQCFANAPGCTGDRQSEGDPYAFTRTPAGWVTTPLAPPATQFNANSAWTVGADEGVALFTMPSGPAGEDEWYARNPTGTFTPLGPATPPQITGLRSFVVSTRLATADLSHLVWENEGPVWPFDHTKGGSVYEYVGAHHPEPFLVGVTGPHGSSALVSTCKTVLGGGSRAGSWGALSADGRTVYFTAEAEDQACANAGGKGPSVDELYARVDGEREDAHTLAISRAECRGNTECTADETHPSDAVFQTASEDGSRVFFLDTQKLTAQATEGTGTAVGGGCRGTGFGCNLYLYDSGLPEGERLIDVSAGDTSGLGPRVQGVVATSADGSHVYFTANGVLAPGATPGTCTSAHPNQGKCNLYVYEHDPAHPEGHVAFITSVPGADQQRNWARPESANVTPDGRFLVFESNGSLTADDIRSAGSVQIFRYDAQTGQLVRVSIGDQGFNDNGNAGTGDATIVQAGYGEFAQAGPPRGDPTMSHDGSFIFFQSPVALTPHALDDVPIGRESGKAQYAQNVYEWHDGRVYLISDGRDLATSVGACQSRAGDVVFVSAVCLYGTDATGHNVFFTTADQLVPSDTDTQLDIYDARICEPAAGNPCIQPAPPALPPCQGEACHGIPAGTPSLLAPGTASFNGEGNLAPAPPAVVNPKPLTNVQKLAKALGSCGKKYKHSKKRRTTCERAAHRAYGAKAKAKKAANHRRPTR